MVYCRGGANIAHGNGPDWIFFCTPFARVSLNVYQLLLHSSYTSAYVTRYCIIISVYCAGLYGRAKRVKRKSLLEGNNVIGSLIWWKKQTKKKNQCGKSFSGELLGLGTKHYVWQKPNTAHFGGTPSWQDLVVGMFFYAEAGPAPALSARVGQEDFCFF